MQKTLKRVLTEYGPIALILYLVIFALVLFGSWLAIRAGWSPASVSGKAGTFAAAYIITKLTQPLRIGATVVLTPIVARVYERVTGRSPRASQATPTELEDSTVK
jgi:hypothetical protein